MRHRIFYSNIEQLYKIETKRFLGKWETRKNYFYTNPEGNVINAKGFFTYEKAKEWISDRYPNLSYFTDTHKNKNIGFEF